MYTLNNPVKYTDPTGHKVEDDIEAPACDPKVEECFDTREYGNNWANMTDEEKCEYNIKYCYNPKGSECEGYLIGEHPNNRPGECGNPEPILLTYDFTAVDWINVAVGVIGLAGDGALLTGPPGIIFDLGVTVLEGWNLNRNIHLLALTPDATTGFIGEEIGTRALEKAIQIGIVSGTVPPGSGSAFSFSLIVFELSKGININIAGIPLD
ncbi:MAG: hypothetical protein OEV06_10005 [Anaerolineae bacterium]|nr:hypothetical protein [Anaerolineae bacterium]